MLKDKGFVHPILLLLGLGLIIMVILMILGVIKVPQPTSKTSSQTKVGAKIESPLKNQYQNPFDRSNQYINPFENLK